MELFHEANFLKEIYNVLVLHTVVYYRMVGKVGICDLRERSKRERKNAGCNIHLAIRKYFVLNVGKEGMFALQQIDKVVPYSAISNCKKVLKH